MTRVLLLILLLAISVDAEARSASAKRSFQKETPCPATGKKRGACPGYVIDHIIPLACGGADAPANMQWQTTKDAKAKDRWERKGCRKTK